MRQRVVLYNPRTGFYTMPLALLAVGSHLDTERYEAVIVDARLEPDPLAVLLEAAKGALCVGMTVLTGTPIRDAVNAARAVKRRYPSLPIVWGGWHASMFGEECLREPSIDVTVQAQGEATFHEIVDRLQRKETLEGCLGCTYRAADGTVIANPPRPFHDVNTFRGHNYALIDVPAYYPLKRKRQLDYIASQGCRFRCAFCADPFVYQRRWAGLEPERIGSELETWQRRYQFSDVNFQDETFFSNEARVVAIAEQFIRRQINIKWAATIRADQCSRLSDAAFETFKRSGLRRVLVGVESGSNDMLKRIKKDITVEQVVETAERCRAFGIRVQFPFIVGFPDESDDSVDATLALVKRLRSMNPGENEAPIFYFKPYPGSTLTQEAQARGYRLPRSLDEWSDFDFGAIGPWVTREKYHRVERFKFYDRLAWDRVPAWKRPLQAMARWRVRRDAYGFPIERFFLGKYGGLS